MKLTAEQFEALDDETRAGFVEFTSFTDGGRWYVPSDVSEWHAHETTALKKALDKERDARSEAEKALKAGDSEALQTERAQLDAEREALQTERETIAAERTKFETDRQAFKKDQLLDAAMHKHSAIADQLRPHLHAHVITLEDGSVVAKGKDGEPLQTEAGDFVSVDELVGQWSESRDWANLFLSRQRSGGGSFSQGDGNRLGDTHPTSGSGDKAEMDRLQRIPADKRTGRDRMRLAQLRRRAPTAAQLEADRASHGSFTTRAN